MRPRALPERGRVASAWLFSIVGHAAALGLGGLIVAASLGRKPAPALPPGNPPPAREPVAVDIELPTVVDGSKLLDSPPPPAPPSEALARGGGEAMPRLDSGRKGRGGTDSSSTPAMNLADRDDDVLLSPEVMSRLDRNQIQRIRASKRRASREDWRASREPMELTFLAEGRKDLDPTRPEHRRLGSADPSQGGRESGAVQHKGGALGAGENEPGAGERARQAGGPVEGGAHASAGRGIRDGARGEDHRDAALVAFARPMVNQGTPSVPADARDRPTDNVDSEQEVAARMQSILHASNAGGAPGKGAGGQAGPGATGAGGRDGPGSVSRALGTGAGPGLDVDPRDRRRSDYMRQVITKLGPHTDWRKLMSVAQAVDGVQGVVVVTFTILSDGSVASASVTRSCGVSDIDENLRRAILKAAPFPPLPPELGTSFRWAFPLDLRNPAVRPRDAGASAKPSARSEP
jgi:TonB family protein